MREIILDTETTGMEPSEGHRLVEIGCVELVNQIPTGRTWHHYLNPERDVPQEAVAVHGLTREFLKDKPVFSQLYTDFIEFVGDATLVIHNAAFDMKFINAELAAVGHAAIPPRRVIDTVAMARKKFPGSPASLDALCRRFGIDNSNRTLHGALLDAQLLSEVYLELLGGRQHGLGLGAQTAALAAENSTLIAAATEPAQRVFREARPHSPSEEELAAHAALREALKDNLWDETAH